MLAHQKSFSNKSGLGYIGESSSVANISEEMKFVKAKEQVVETSVVEKVKPKKKPAKGKKNSVTDDPPTGEKKSGRREALLATYEPDKRLDSWLKVKKDYSASFDTLDLIPVAGWHGQGRKAKWWSPILLAVRNEENGTLEAVCKCISGFTDAFYKANKKFYDDGSGDPDEDTSKTGARDKDQDTMTEDADMAPMDGDGDEEEEDAENGTRKFKNTRRKKPSYIEYGGHPDVWFEPQEVWEMAFADITISPTYTAAIGLVSQERGLSLRFPRFLRKREDKSIEEASTNQALAGFYRKQMAAAPAALPKENDEDGDEE